MDPLSCFFSRHHQSQIRMPRRRPAQGTISIIIIILEFSHSFRHFSQSPILKGPLNSQASLFWAISMFNIELQLFIHIKGKHTTFLMIPFHSRISLLGQPFMKHPPLISGSNQGGSRTARHNISIRPYGRPTR